MKKESHQVAGNLQINQNRFVVSRENKIAEREVAVDVLEFDVRVEVRYSFGHRQREREEFGDGQRAVVTLLENEVAKG